MHLSEFNSKQLKWGLLSWFRHEKGVVVLWISALTVSHVGNVYGSPYFAEEVSQAPVPKSEGGGGGGGAVVRTSSAEKRQHSVYKQLTSCSSSSSSDDELKELQLGDGDGTKRHVHVRHKPPQKERKIVSLSSTSPDDDEVFSYSKPGCVAKRLKCSAPQPIPGRYTDFDKMRRTPMSQVSKVSIKRGQCVLNENVFDTSESSLCGSRRACGFYICM